MDAAGVLDQRYDEVDDLKPRPQRALAAARRLPRSPRRRPQRADGHRRQAGRPPRRHPRRRGAVRGSLPNQAALSDLKMNRLLDYDRRVGGRATAWRTRRAAAALRAHPHRRLAAAIARPRPRRDPHRHLGDRVPPRLLVARRAGVRPQGPHPPRRRRGRFARPVPDGHAVPAAPQVGAHRRRGRRCTRAQRPPAGVTSPARQRPARLPGPARLTASRALKPAA